MQSQLTGLGQNPASLSVLSSAFLILENRRIIFKLIREQVINDTGELVCNRSNRFRRAEACLHSTEVIPEECLAFVECLGGKPQGQRGAILGRASP
jgi:hypothetical protein